MANRIGEQLGNYRLIRLLGQGGFAEVYLAEHMYLRTQVAIKLLYGKLTAQDVQAFTNEAQTIAALRHPHILRILDFGFAQTLPFLVMDYAPGGTLRDRHAPGSLVPLPYVIFYIKQVAAALAYAHTNKLIHRDVKPENMLLSADGTLLLSDFGIVTTAHSTSSMKTVDNTGTVHYMAPEQIKGKPRTASDQYALAIVAYEWLCGERPFPGETSIEIAMRQLSDDPPSLCQKAPSLSSVVEQVVFKALSKDPQQRFPDIAVFSSALEQASRVQQAQTPFFQRQTSASPVQPSLSSTMQRDAAPLLQPIQPFGDTTSISSPPPVAVLVVSEQGDGDYSSISDAVEHAQPHTRILVRPGTYVETVVLTKDVEIVGDGQKEQIFLENHNHHSFISEDRNRSSCIIMRTERALVQGITIRCSRDHAITINIPEGQLHLINCDVSSREGTAISIYTKAADPIIRNCVIFSGGTGGTGEAVNVSNYARGLLEECKITSPDWVAVNISEGGNPHLRRCKIHGRYKAVQVERYGRGTIEECTVTGEIDIEEGCQTILSNNVKKK